MYHFRSSMSDLLRLMAPIINFICDTICSPKPCQRFLEDCFVCILQPKSRNSTFVIESAVFYCDNLKSFKTLKNSDTVLGFGYLAVKLPNFKSVDKSCPSWNLECLIVLT